MIGFAINAPEPKCTSLKNIFLATIGRTNDIGRCGPGSFASANVRSSEKDRLRHSSQPLVNTMHPGPCVNRALTPRS
jgi:hypothetical protein